MGIVAYRCAEATRLAQSRIEILRVCRRPSAYGRVESHVREFAKLAAAKRDEDLLVGRVGGRSAFWTLPGPPYKPIKHVAHVCKHAGLSVVRFASRSLHSLLERHPPASRLEQRGHVLILMYILTYILLRTVHNIGSHEHLRNYGVGPGCLVFLHRTPVL